MRQFFSTSQNAQRYRAAFFLSLPALIGLFLFHYWPIADTLRLSFTDFKVFTGEFTFTGLKNYDIALNDPLLLLSLKNTALFFLIKVPLQMALGLCLALLVAKPGRDSTLLRTLVLIPTVTSMVVASIVWGMMFHSDIGIVNGVLEVSWFAGAGFLARQVSGAARPCVHHDLERCRLEYDLLPRWASGDPDGLLRGGAD